MVAKVPFVERFKRYVKMGDWHECWPWTGSGGVYGLTKVNGRNKGAHVCAYEMFHGPVSEGLIVRHSCDTPRCCNPAHLVAGTYLDNMRDRRERRRQNAQRGEAAHMAKLTEQEVISIRQSPLRGYQLAKLYGVHKNTIYAIRKGRSWQHV